MCAGEPFLCAWQSGYSVWADVESHNFLRVLPEASTLLGRHDGLRRKHTSLSAVPL